MAISLLKQPPQTAGAAPSYLQPASDVVTSLGSDTSSGLAPADVGSRLSSYGPNQITGEKLPLVWAVTEGTSATR